MLDLDGVVYVGGRAVPGAPDHLESARKLGMRLAFVTNNASRTPETVAAHLVDLGIAAEPGDVVTSAQAAARLVARRIPARSRVVALGAEGLVAALQSEGLVVVGVEDEAQALVSGYGPDLRWSDLMRAAVRVRDGLWWVASNTDLSIPTAYGTAPGHGVLVDMLARFSGVTPEVAGKPARPLLDETVRRVGGTRPLMIGDRLDTDIEGARIAEVDSLLVLTGVTGLTELVAARVAERPTFIACDLRGLLEPHPSVTESGGATRCGGWSVSTSGGTLEVEGYGDAGDWWRAVAVASWRHLDEHGDVVDVTGLETPADAPAR
ncbi:MAG: HAD-IIA family hydrolase [Actinobacteria bacterium]|nr:HAD-IIA family hydrolase [Actinomycetota bacterium]